MSVAKKVFLEYFNYRKDISVMCKRGMGLLNKSKMYSI